MSQERQEWEYQSETDTLTTPLAVDEWMRDHGWPDTDRIHRAREILLLRWLARRDRLGENTR